MSLPALAPTTPPDIGASTKAAALAPRVWDTSEATAREVMGSIVEQSMKRRLILGFGGLAREREARIVS